MVEEQLLGLWCTTVGEQRRWVTRFLLWWSASTLQDISIFMNGATISQAAIHLLFTQHHKGQISSWCLHALHWLRSWGYYATKQAHHSENSPVQGPTLHHHYLQRCQQALPWHQPAVLFYAWIFLSHPARCLFLPLHRMSKSEKHFLIVKR